MFTYKLIGENKNAVKLAYEKKAKDLKEEEEREVKRVIELAQMVQELHEANIEVSDNKLYWQVQDIYFDQFKHYLNH